VEQRVRAQPADEAEAKGQLARASAIPTATIHTGNTGPALIERHKAVATPTMSAYAEHQALWIHCNIQFVQS
jgi:hypothetical protein